MDINFILILSIGIVSFIAFSNRELMNKLLFTPHSMDKPNEFYRFLSSAWIHKDTMHLLVNGIVLYSFGLAMQNWYMGQFGTNLGIIFYLGLFLFSVIVAHLPSYFKHKNNPRYASLGASGGVSGVLFASILIQPFAQIYLMGIIPIPGILFGLVYLGYTSYMAKQATDHINHDAHMFGALAGMAYLIATKPQVAVDFVNRVVEFFRLMF